MSREKPALTHTNRTGEAAMVDVSAKPLSSREAVAEAFIRLRPDTIRLIQANRVKKGDVLATARIAGIQAAKQTQVLIPLCHQIPLCKAEVSFAFEKRGIRITATTKTVAQTGVEMEALAAASIAALAIYDMCKAVDPKMRIDGMRLLSKTKNDIASAAK